MNKAMGFISEKEKVRFSTNYWSKEPKKMYLKTVLYSHLPKSSEASNSRMDISTKLNNLQTK